ncbi:MAG: zinc ribbon domain-containing protein [Desulfobacterales bacterium]|jgi:putative FmdB family regulatory protein|nr:zinc ribbon domain-containing protein [Desulfobacterales bacterium]MDL1989104.1 zinc ribbon domain-containing protein [Deltaproteobacteria bacterium]
MPIYEYKCENCNHIFEKLVFTSNDEHIECPKCDDIRVKRLISSTCHINSSGGGGCAPSPSRGFS